MLNVQGLATVLSVANGEPVAGGMVCEVLTLVAAGKLELRPGSVKVHPMRPLCVLPSTHTVNVTCCTAALFILNSVPT